MKNSSKLSVSEALRKIELKEFPPGTEVDFDYVKVEALDVIKLVKNGVDVPEDKIYYDDDDIDLSDPDFDGDWIRVEPINHSVDKKELKIKIDQDIYEWINSKKVNASDLIEDLLKDFYNSNKLMEQEFEK